MAKTLELIRNFSIFLGVGVVRVFGFTRLLFRVNMISLRVHINHECIPLVNRKKSSRMECYFDILK
jgi:hypothetical protein